jgi:phosphoribosyl-ATP pyrophosphohydrolase
MNRMVIRSLVIMDIDGKILDIGMMNAKAFKKTVENKILWVVNSDTERVLPYGGECRIEKIEEAPFGYMAYLAKGEKSENCGNNELKIITDTEDVQSLDFAYAVNVTGNVKSPGGASENGTGSGAVSGSDILPRLAGVIAKRHEEMPEGSYTTSLFSKGINKIAQKVGEEAVELVIEAKDDNDDLFLNEAADLVYHLLVLLSAKDKDIRDVSAILEQRHKK